MKNTIIAMLLGAASLSVVSCGYLDCLSATNMEECMISKSVENAIGYLADSAQIDSKEKAAEFASTWSKVQTAVETAQKFGVKIPDSAKKAYNETLTRMKKHNYFGSEELRSAMSTAKAIS